MRRIGLFVFGCLICVAAVAHAQVVPSAYRGQLTLTAGGMGSIFQPDYAGLEVPQGGPYPLFGFGAYVDLKVTRWIGVEGEARWLRLNSYLDITEDNYLLGPKVPIHEFKRFGATPYGKALFGIGRMNYEYNQAHGRFSDIALGGGVDLKLTKRISVRPFDFEYQLWPNWTNSNLQPYTLKPYGASAGIGYKIF